MKKDLSHTPKLSDLYQAAIKFRDHACWNWMMDGDLFGVENPETGEIGYCSILGNLGEVFALNVYPGSKGLESYWKIYEYAKLMEEGVHIPMHLIMTSQICLMASFENRKDLEKVDLDQIKSLNLKFKGSHNWPLFRNYLSGYAPWFFNEQDVQFMTVALEQALIMAEEVKKKPELLEPVRVDEEMYLVRRLRNGQWLNEWHTPEVTSEPEKQIIVNEILLKKLKNQKLPRLGTWICDCITLPVRVEEGPRPFYPVAFPVINQQGFMVMMEMFKPDDLETMLPNAFLDTLQKVGNLPQEIFVGSDLAYDLLEPITTSLKISIHQDENLPELEALISHLDRFI
ncbi:MAG: hypothetical protein HQM11_04150 [SAR324 cluster bacterium]|nr:hypothetical protein [SAR324 cluster bacterium]